MKQKIFKLKQALRFRRFARKNYAVFNSLHKVINTGVITGCMLTFAATTETAAQSRVSAVGDSIREQELEELIVTGSKAELTMTQTAKLVTVISRAEIERQAVESVSDLLKSIVGLDVRQRGPNGVLSGVAVRGGTFEQTAILLNGANLTNPQTGHYNLDLPINLSDVERIEIIQGPTSLLYGAGAFSGGINIVTKKNSDTGLSLEAKGGMHKFFEAGAREAVKTGASGHSLSSGYASSEGYMRNSDYQTFNALWQSNFSINAHSHLDLQWGINDKKYGANTFYSAAYPDQYDESRSLFAAIKATTGQILKITPQLYWNRHFDHYQLIKNQPTGENFHRTDVVGFNLNIQYGWIAGITNFGGEIRNEGIISGNLGKDSLFNRKPYLLTDNRTNLSAFLEHSFVFEQFTLNLGLLANYNTAFTGDAGLYPSVNAAYWLTPNWKIFASWNNATRMPTFTDLYYKGRTHKGNSDVRPEKSVSLEWGLKYVHPAVSASANGFYMKGVNLIDWVKQHPDSLWETRNLVDLDKTGFETNFTLNMAKIFPKVSGVHLRLGYMFIHQTKDASGLISNYVMDYLKHKFTAGLSHPIYKNLSADWQFRLQDRAGSYTEYKNNQTTGIETPYKPFSILDVKFNWKMNRVNLFLNINNLFDTYYFDLGNVPQPGIWITGGIKYKLPDS
ncbi:MAG: TonB-dependent receptor [Dysgonamonadaceae bacterium]|jgi:iron complex outermembrane receptor protein|nr:TonB-dependent receptor [Dysgonamonadaceae bacterium]